MRIGFFGGSFDPPHLGHLAIARAAAQTFALDRVLFVPTAHQPLKPAAAAGYEARLAMVALLCESDPRFEASALEAPSQDHAPNYTVDTLTRLRATLSPNDALYVLAGADAFLDLRHWREPDRLLQLAEWIVVSRPGFSLAGLAPLGLSAKQQARIHLLSGIAEPATATHIRALLAIGDPCTGLLPPAVLTYIRNYHLYST